MEILANLAEEQRRAWLEVQRDVVLQLDRHDRVLARRHVDQAAARGRAGVHGGAEDRGGVLRPAAARAHRPDVEPSAPRASRRRRLPDQRCGRQHRGPGHQAAAPDDVAATRQPLLRIAWRLIVMHPESSWNRDHTAGAIAAKNGA